MRCDGRIGVRSGPRRGVAIAQDERILNERRRFRDQPFDSTGYRNPNLAVFLAELGFAQRFGVGISIARRGCERNGNPWRQQWEKHLTCVPQSLAKTTELPEGRMDPVGYVVLQHAVRWDQPVKTCQRWLDRLPSVYRKSVLNEAAQQRSDSPKNDPHCLAKLKHYRSLMPLAQTARKPMFLLTPRRWGHCRALQGSSVLPQRLLRLGREAP